MVNPKTFLSDFGDASEMLGKLSETLKILWEGSVDDFGSAAAATAWLERPAQGASVVTTSPDNLAHLFSSHGNPFSLQTTSWRPSFFKLPPATPLFLESHFIVNQSDRRLGLPSMYSES